MILLKMKKENKTTTEKKKRFLEEFARARGIVSVASNNVGISRQQVWNWTQSDPDFKTLYDNVLEDQIDFVENKLIEKIEDGSDTAIIFYLKCKGKKRGYVEKQEFDINNMTKNVKVSFGELNDEDTLNLLNG
jgi:hypothetical protein